MWTVAVPADSAGLCLSVTQVALELNGPMEQPMGRNSSSVSMSGSSLLYLVLARTRGSSLASSVCVMSQGAGWDGRPLSSSNVVCLGPCFSLSL